MTRAEKDKLIIDNMPFAIYIVNQMVPNFYDRPDYISAAYEGLCIAANRYDPDRGVKFISYAVYPIKERVLLEMRNKKKICDNETKMDDYNDYEPYINETKKDDNYDDVVWMILNSLEKDKHKQIFIAHLGGGLQQLADELGYTRQNIYALKDKILIKIRQKFPNLKQIINKW